MAPPRYYSARLDPLPEPGLYAGRQGVTSVTSEGDPGHGRRGPAGLLCELRHRRWAMLAARRKTESGAEKRVMFRNILLASDYSPSANLAMPYAAGMARSFGATLYAMHVQEP